MSDQRQVAVSYDVGNEFFRLWLDKRMSYTCGVFDNTDDLDHAQVAKLNIMADYAKVTPDSRVLDLGCGWGANLEHLVLDRGVRQAHGITLSLAQYHEITARNLPRVTAECLSYTDFVPQHQFDAIISIGMIEHLATPEQTRNGEAVAIYRDLFRRAWQWSEPGSHFALQCGVRDRVPRQRGDIRDLAWLSNHIFPGGMDPRIEDVVCAVGPYWEVVQMRTRRLDYRLTCLHWRERLRAHENEIRERWGSTLFDEYDRYLSICIRAFEQRYQSLVQWSLRRVDEL